MIASIDWRGLLAFCAIAITLFAILAYQRRQTAEQSAHYLNYGALSAELLGVALTAYWAVRAPDTGVLAVVFMAGFIGMAVGKAVLIPQVVRYWGQPQALAVAIIGFTTAYTLLYSTGLFNAVNDAGQEAQAKLEASAPALALDNEITQTQAKIARLAGFSNADKAQAEIQAVAQANQQAKATNQALIVELSQWKAKRDNCPRNYITKCIRPAEAEIARINALLAQVPMAQTTSYAQKYDQYEGLQTHLTSLQNKREALSETGQGVQSMWKPEDKMIAWLFGTSEEKASQVKWLIFTFLFDFISLCFRIMSAIILPHDKATELKHQMNRLLSSGLSVEQAAAYLSQNQSQETIKPAKVKLSSEEVPAMDVGGRILADGLIHGHADEVVLNAKATAFVDTHFPQLLDALNAGQFEQVNDYIGNAYKSMTKGNDYKAMSAKQRKPFKNQSSASIERKVVGGIYHCENCGAEFKARTVWHRFCAPCGAERKKGVLRAKAKSKNQS